MNDSETRIDSPFAPEQVVALNSYQRSGVGHPFTCGDRKYHPADEIDKGCLVATVHGWICPVCWDGTLEDMQNWAHANMARFLRADDIQKASGFRLVRQCINSHYEWLHKFCTKNREALENIGNASCFYCLECFPISKITKWVGSTETTALCSCGTDAVLPARIKYCVGDEMEEYVVTENDLEEMRNYWFYDCKIY